jgi:modulator of FtsH protease HflC
MARSSSKPMQAILGAAGVLGAVVATTLCLFAVGDGERAVVTSFGRPVQVVTTPGLGEEDCRDGSGRRHVAHSRAQTFL